MSLLEQLQGIFPKGSDYLIRDDGSTGLVVFAEQPEDTEPRVTDFEGRKYTVQQIAVAELQKFYPCTSLVNGERYEGKPENPAISFVSDTQVSALKEWLIYHTVALEAAKSALISREVSMASAIFNNALNGLVALLQSANVDWISASPETKPTDLIPGTDLSFMELSAKVELYTGLNVFLNTPMPRTGMTPMQLLTKVK